MSNTDEYTMEELPDVRTALTNGENTPGDAAGNDVTYSNKDCAQRRTGTIKVFLLDNVFLISVLVCAGLGFVIGFGLRGVGDISDDAMWLLGVPGEVFMRTLKLIILPLIVTSVLAGAASLDPRTNGKITGVALLYMAALNASGVLVGVAMFYTVSPHTGVAEQISKSTTTSSCFGKDVKLSTGDIFADMIRNIFPDNMVTACFQKAQTYYKKIEVGPECGANVTVIEYVRALGSSGGINILGIIVFCLAIGIACGKVGEKARPFVDFFTSASEVIMKLLTWVIWLTPIGVLSLIATSIVKVDDIEASMASLALFAATVLAALFSLVLVEVPLIYFIFLRKNPFPFLFHALRPMMVSFAPASSAIAIPEVINVAENVYGVDPVISRFITLFGAATCRFGSAVFIVICSLFLCALEGVGLGAGQVVYMSVLTTAVTFAVPSVPSASVICVVIILSAFNVHSTNIGLIMALEWLVDRVRTSTNVLGILNANLVMNKIFG